MSAMTSSTPFPLFTSLPTELRLHIWKLACEARVVEVSYDPEEDRCTSPTSVPSILHVCHEARSEALRGVYKLAFGTRSHGPRIYFARGLDTLYIPRPPSMGYDDHARSFAELVSGGTDDVVALAVDYVPPAIKRPWETYNKYVLMQSFRRAYQVILVVNATAETGTEFEGDESDDGIKGNGKADWSLMDPVGEDEGEDEVYNSNSNSNSHNEDGDDGHKSSCNLCRRILDEVKASFFYEVGGEFVIDEKGLAVLEPLHMPSLVPKVKIRKC